MEWLLVGRKADARWLSLIKFRRRRRPLRHLVISVTWPPGPAAQRFCLGRAPTVVAGPRQDDISLQWLSCRITHRRTTLCSKKRLGTNIGEFRWGKCVIVTELQRGGGVARFLRMTATSKVVPGIQPVRASGVCSDGNPLSIPVSTMTQLLLLGLNS